ncbi:MAG: tetratricopeptide repeat protein [Sulfuritalea sp.]|nr:tetratricopeptide repeat protein [Sulfuritalea sp.]
MKVIGKQGSGGRHADAESLNLMRLVEERRYAELEHSARKILGRNGRHSLALRALTFALVGLGRYEDVVAEADRALRLAPGDGEVHNNRAIALSMLMRWDEAIADFHEALRRAPEDPEIHMNLGSAYVRMCRWDDAVPALLKAIELHPGDYLDAIVSLASALTNAGRLDEAATCFEALWDGHPDHPEYLYGLLAVNLRRCVWRGMSDQAKRLADMAPAYGRSVASAWWAYWFWFFRGSDHAAIGGDFARAKFADGVLESKLPMPMQWRPGARRLKLGYLSADFRVHPVAEVVAEVIERHDRDRVELFAYSIGEDDRSEQRRRFLRGFEHFVDLATVSVRETAARIRADGIDVLVDLTGWTAGGRVESLALRCAPVQVNWLGYAGTLGHPRLADYIIGDPVITPLSDQRYYAEQIAQMPYSYMPVDTTRRVTEAPTRGSQGLPDTAFVLCSFNNIYKFNPPLFDLWCSMLKQMPDAVLWLPRHGEAVAENLRREFVARGLDAERLVLAGRIDSIEEHLGRMQLADLALDTFPYNSHSTGVNILWAGVPMVSKLGDTFAGRVGASLLAAVGLPELIVDSDDAYAALVLELYRDRARLADLRERLVRARQTAPLFDVARFVHDLEGLYFRMAERAIVGDEAPVESARSAPGHLEPGPAS